MGNNPKSSEPEKSSTEQQLQGNNSSRNAGEEYVPSGRSLPRPESVVAPTQLTTDTTMPPARPAGEARGSSSRVVQGEIGSGGDGGSGEGGDQSSGKSRWRHNDPGASSSRGAGTGAGVGAAAGGGSDATGAVAGASGDAAGGGQRARRRRIDAGVPAVCAVCNRSFPSFYALFGHLRSHNKREWGGAFPPPVYNPDWGNRGNKKDEQKEKQKQKQTDRTTQQVIEQQVIPALLDVAQETLAKLQEQGKQIESRRRLRLDLNAEPKEEDSTESSSSSANSQEKAETATAGLNLNLPPPKEDDDDDDDVE